MQPKDDYIIIIHFSEKLLYQPKCKKRYCTEAPVNVQIYTGQAYCYNTAITL